MERNPNKLGATYLGGNACRFRVWSPSVAPLGVRLLRSDRLVSLKRAGRGYYETVVEDVRPDDTYFYQLGIDKLRADPASRFQPQGVHGPSAVLDDEFPWEDGNWSGLALADYIIYELHVGCFSPEGTFEAILPYLDYLQSIGITALELMPVAQFPGARNWGYDGVFPFAAQNSYGGPTELKKLVNGCHRRGLAVILDVVYNHIGPEGNYLADFGPYFTERYKTPWGLALNFDGPFSDEVRQYFIQNALSWLIDFHFDALRLDAVHAILDHSPFTFLEELAVAVQSEAERLNRRMVLIAESAANDARLVRARERGGYGLDAQWNDDFHHGLHTLLTGETNGYYRDYGKFTQLVKAYREGFAYSGECSEFRRRRHGSSSRDLPAERFVVFAQNHDQVGNRMRGDRLGETVSFEDLKLAAGLVILSPYIPLLFMGEEYGETAPFPYFVSHSDPGLIEAVRRGRRAEFASFEWQGEVPDPQDEATFLSAKLSHNLANRGEHKILLEFYRELIRLRKTMPALAALSKQNMEITAHEKERVLMLRRWSGADSVIVVANLAASEADAGIAAPAGCWRKTIDSAERRWNGAGSRLPDKVHGGAPGRLIIAARSIALYHRGEENA
ncbi:MAG: malto-oligosyltrehalose trehalohydrolase [Chloroflexota bacterium]